MKKQYKNNKLPIVLILILLSITLINSFMILIIWYLLELNSNWQLILKQIIYNL